MICVQCVLRRRTCYVFTVKVTYICVWHLLSQTIDAVTKNLTLCYIVFSLCVFTVWVNLPGKSSFSDILAHRNFAKDYIVCFLHFLQHVFTGCFSMSEYTDYCSGTSSFSDIAAHIVSQNGHIRCPLIQQQKANFHPKTEMFWSYFVEFFAGIILELSVPDRPAQLAALPRN